MPKKLSREREGEVLIIVEAILWGLFPVVLLLTYNSIHPFYTAAMSTLIAALFFGVCVFVRGKTHEILKKHIWRDVISATLLIAVGFYSLVFWGTSLTSANNASIILLLEALFTMIILYMWGKESVTRIQVFGAIVTVIGAALILFPGRFEPKAGDLILVFATLLPPVGNYFQQRARREISAFTIMFLRSAIGGLVLLIASLLFIPLPTLTQLENGAFYLLLNGILLLGFSKILWIEAIHRLSISKAASLGACSPFFTLIFSYFFLGEAASWWQLLALPLVVSGVVILMRGKTDVDSVNPRAKKA